MFEQVGHAAGQAPSSAEAIAIEAHDSLAAEETDNKEVCSIDEAHETGLDKASAVRRRWLKPALWVLLTLVLAVGGHALWKYQTVGQYMQSTNDAFVSVEEVPVAAKLAGYVDTLAVHDHAAVRSGQTLLLLDTTDYTNRLDQANAQIGLARANEIATLSGLGEAEAAIRQAQAAVMGASAELAYLDAELARLNPLVAAGAEPHSALDQLTANRAKAAADLRARQAGVVAARERVGSIRAQAGATRAQMMAANVQRMAARNDLEATALTAPLGGRVGNLSVRPGQFVQPGQRLMSIIPVGDLFVTANFKENQIGLMRPGQPATIEVDALPGVRFDGVVESISPGTGATFSLVPPENATGNFTKIVQRVPVRIRIKAGPEARKVLVAGLSLEVSIDTRSARGSIEAIRREQDARI